MSIYDPQTRASRIAWAVFSIAAFAFAVWQYVRYLIVTA